MQKKNKIVLKIVSLSLLVLVQTDALARGRGNGSNVYGKMISIEKNMAREMRGQDLSNTYSGKLESNLAELDSSLRQAASLAGAGRGSRRDSIRGGRSVESDDEGLQLLVKVSYEAIDVLKDLPYNAQENLQDAIESAGDDWDDELVDQAQEVLDELEDVIGSDSKLRSHPTYRRTDNPARRRMFEQKHHSKKSKAQRNADRNYRKKNKGQKRSGKSASGYARGNKNSQSGENQHLTKAQRKAVAKQRASGQEKQRAGGQGQGVGYDDSFTGDRGGLGRDALRLLSAGSLSHQIDDESSFKPLTDDEHKDRKEKYDRWAGARYTKASIKDSSAI